MAKSPVDTPAPSFAYLAKSDPEPASSVSYDSGQEKNAVGCGTISFAMFGIVAVLAMVFHEKLPSLAEMLPDEPPKALAPRLPLRGEIIARIAEHNHVFRADRSTVIMQMDEMVRLIGEPSDIKMYGDDIFIHYQCADGLIVFDSHRSAHTVGMVAGKMSLR